MAHHNSLLNSFFELTSDTSDPCQFTKIGVLSVDYFHPSTHPGSTLSKNNGGEFTHLLNFFIVLGDYCDPPQPWTLMAMYVLM